MSEGQPRIVVFSSLFPSAVAPTAGVFIRERMFRVAKHLPLVVVAPQAWSPIDWVIRLFRNGFRRPAATYELMDGVPVYRPRVLSVPGILKRWDGWLMARGSRSVMRRVCSEFHPTLLDAHFLYPDGYAASLLADEFNLPLTITMRGSKDQLLLGSDREPMLRKAMDRAAHLFSVSDALKADVAIRLGQPPEKVTVIGNGVDVSKFEPVDQAAARRKLGIDTDARVLIGVGNRIEGKGFHRVIPLLPALRDRFPKLVYLIVGGSGSQSDMFPVLQRLAAEHGVNDVVRFCGVQPQEDLKWFYGAADVFALATAHEGWANVFLEAMACGLPVVTTRVGGNAQVVCRPELGTLVDYWNPDVFLEALADALQRNWPRKQILEYAAANGWDGKIACLVRELARHSSPLMAEEERQVSWRI